MTRGLRPLGTQCVAICVANEFHGFRCEVFTEDPTGLCWTHKQAWMNRHRRVPLKTVEPVKEAANGR